MVIASAPELPRHTIPDPEPRKESAMPRFQNDLKTARGDLRGLRTDAVPSSRKARIHLLTPGQSLAAERGEAEGPDESPLTSWGRYRTSLFSADLMRIPFAGIHAGEGLACRETAAILSAGRSVAVRVDSALTGMAPGEEEATDSDARRTAAYLAELVRGRPAGDLLVVLPARLFSALTGHPPSPPPAPLTLRSWAADRARTPLRGYPEAKRGTR